MFMNMLASKFKKQCAAMVKSVQTCLRKPPSNNIAIPNGPLLAFDINEEFTAMAAARETGRLPSSSNTAIRRLVLDGANPNARDKKGNPALLAFVKCGDMEMVKFLVSHGADPNITDRASNPVLLTAIQQDNPEMVKLLITHGANPNARDRAYNPVLLTAIQQDNVKMVKLLVSLGATSDSCDRSGYPVYSGPALKDDRPMLDALRRTATTYIAAQFNMSFAPPAPRHNPYRPRPDEFGLALSF